MVLELKYTLDNVKEGEDTQVLEAYLKNNMPFLKDIKVSLIASSSVKDDNINV